MRSCARASTFSEWPRQNDVSRILGLQAALFATKTRKGEIAKEDVFVDCLPLFRPFVLSRFRGEESLRLEALDEDLTVPGVVAGRFQLPPERPA